MINLAQMDALLIAIIAGALTWIILSLTEKLYHRWTHNPSRAYRVGVWLFAALIALYTYFTSLGR